MACINWVNYLSILISILVHVISKLFSYGRLIVGSCLILFLTCLYEWNYIFTQTLLIILEKKLINKMLS